MWDSRYGASPELAYGEKANDWLSTGSELAKFVPDGGKIVELASGEGRNVVWLASQGYDAHGVDISAKGVEKAIKFAESRGVGDKTTFTVGDATAHGLDDSYDAVVCVFAHMPPPLKVKLFENVMRILKPNGVLIGQWYTPTHVEKKDAGGWGTGGPPVKALCECSDVWSAPLLPPPLPGVCHSRILQPLLATWVVVCARAPSQVYRRRS